MNDSGQHGDVSVWQLEQWGLDPAEVIDFAVNVNPLGCSPRVREAVQEAARNASISRYPERYAERLVARIAEHCGMPPQCVLVGNGATELIWSVIRGLVHHRQKLLCFEPTFSEALQAARAHGLSIEQLWADSNHGFTHDWDAADRHLQLSRPGFVYLCIPNNPTGVHPPRERLLELFNKYSRTLFLLDESFLSLSRRFEEASVEHPSNTIRIRSLTKDLGIAGLRLGYAIGSAQSIAQLRALQPPWSVNACAQAAGWAGLDHWEDVSRSREVLLQQAKQLSNRLLQLGLRPIPSSSIFQLVDVGDARRVSLACRSRGVLVRDCSSFGLPRHIRVCARPLTDQGRLLSALNAPEEPQRHTDSLDSKLMNFRALSAAPPGPSRR